MRMKRRSPNMIQCDEQKPQCGNCLRLGFSEPCQFSPLVPKQRQPQPTPPLSSRRASETEIGSDEDVETFSLLDMELLHHFITQTSSVLTEPGTSHVWQNNVPTLAYSNGHLMSGLVAIAALHKATTSPDGSPLYVQRAMEALNLGLPRLRALVANLENESPHTVVAYSALVVLYAFALPPVRFRGQKVDNPLPALFEAFNLLQGQVKIIAMTWVHIHKGPLGILMVNDIFIDVEKDEFALNIEGMLADEQPFKNKMIGKIAELDRDVHMYGELDRLDAYRDALLKTQRLINISLPDDYELGKPFSGSPSKTMSWPSRIEPEFLELLQSMQHPALTILGFYIFFYSDSCWFTHGWRTWILDFLVELEMPQPWSRHVRWIHAMARNCP